MRLAELAAAGAMEDRAHPAKLAVQQTGLMRDEIEEVRVAVEQVTRRIPGVDERLARIEARQESIEAGQQRIEAKQRRTQDMLAAALAALSVSGYAEVHASAVVTGVADASPPMDEFARRAPDQQWLLRKPWERMALRHAQNLAGLPDVGELLVVEMRAVALLAGRRRVYADLVVTDSAGGRWLADLKRHPGSRADRESRARLVQDALDAAGNGDWRWVTLTPTAVARATNWRELVAAS